MDLKKKNASGTSNANQNNIPGGNQPNDKTSGCIIGLVIITVAIILIVVLIKVAQVFRVDTQEKESIEAIEETYVTDDPVSTYEEISTPVETDLLQESTTEKPIEPVIKPEEKPKEKKNLDPRFYHPDGTAKQPWEYMEYFNEDDEDYEDGYEDGYDDGIDGE